MKTNFVRFVPYAIEIASYLPLELSLTTCREFGSEADTKIKVQAALSYPGL